MIHKPLRWLALLLAGLAAVVALLLPQVGRGLDGQWEEIGAGSADGRGVSALETAATRPDVAVGPDGVIVLAWSHNVAGNTEIYARQWRDGTWQEVGAGSATGGGISNTDGASENPSVAVGTDGVVYVAWDDDSSGNHEIYVRRFANGTWSELHHSASEGGISGTADDSLSPSLALGPENLPYVAWQENAADGDSEIYVRRWNANAWGEVGAGAASGGGISNNDGDSTLPALAVNPTDGTVFVVWADMSGSDTEIYGRTYSGSSWDELGNGAASGGGISDNDGTSRNADIAQAGDGSIYVSWSDDSSGNYEIYVRRWDGATWAEVGAGSAVAGGISQTERHSHAPRIAIDAAGRPAVVWYQATAADAEIYLRQWDGTSWAELGGSGSGGGVSNNSSASSNPVAAADGSRLVVAWNDNGGGSYAIYARQWAGGDGPPPTATSTSTSTPTATSTLPGPTATATAMNTPTNTAVPPTATGTSTSTPTATSTLPGPTATATSTNTPVPPTATFTVEPTTVPTGTPAPNYFPLVLYQPPPTATPRPTNTAMPAATLAPTATIQPIDELQNGDFERGRNGDWTEASVKGYAVITNQRPEGLSAHSGAWISWLGGVANETSAIRQQVTIPPNRPYLQYWHWIASSDACGYDVAGVVFDRDGDDDDVIDSFWLCNSNDTNGWRMRVLDLRAYAGQSVKLMFLAGTDGLLNSNWFVDDVVFVSSPGRERGQEVDGEAAARLGAALVRLSTQTD